jgi:tRNA-Thr(GGU) m(6)t(6)A37 methyltransferase TsaA
MTEAIAMRPIGWVRGGRIEAIDDDWGGVEAEIALDPAQFTAEATAGLGDFSHLEVIYHFHKAEVAKIETGARHPRGNPEWPRVGVFAQRAKGRPNRIGVTVCEIVAVAGLSVRVRGLDAIDGTPVLDLKPVMAGFLPRGAVREPAWAGELMADYW